MYQNSFTLRSVVIGLVMLMFACSEDIIKEAASPDVSRDAESFSDELIPNQYIVVFNTEKTGHAGARFADPRQAREFVKNETLRIIRTAAPDFTEKQLLNIYSASINGAAVQLSADKAEALRKDERIAYIEQDRIITMAPPWERGGDEESTVQETPYGITRVNGGINYTGKNVAWVIDTGIDLDHPDLNVDESRSVTFISKGRDANTADDFNGHGTHVAGTIAAVDNDEGVIGVAAGATVVAVKVLDGQGSGTYSGVIAGVDHVGANGKAGDVANMSLGGSYSKSLNDAVIAASTGNGREDIHIYFTVAAGNDSDDANKYSPASANGDYIRTISAMDVRKNYTDTDPDNDDVWASFSNWANPPIDYCAPGVGVKSTYKDGTYKTLSGTSMAAPHAAGVLLLGNTSTDGNVKGDPDGNADAIIVH